MGDLFGAFAFVLCQVLLLGLLFSPLLLRKRDAAGRARIPMAAKTFVLGVAVGATIMTAGIEGVSLSRGNHLTRLNHTPSGSSTTSPVASNHETGGSVVIRFDPEVCLAFNLGTLQCGSDYEGRYDVAANRWIVTGFYKGAK